MSGIAGIVNLDGAPADPSILARMMEFLAFRGPDGQHTWTGGAAGLGHTLAKTTDESEGERQPLTVDGEVWIVADARIDGRSGLIAGLKARGHGLEADVPDVELIVRAYSVWQEECVEHLLGDFAFGIWDAPRRRLFCARDHMGVKPLYYAHIGHCVVFSNTLECVRQHPLVSDRLNDLAVADFLLFNFNQDKATTTFAEIQRIPPAHSVAWSQNGLQLRRYWTLPIDEPIYYRQCGDYVAHFRELLRAAAGDRLRTNRVGIFMSGGLDSTTLAVAARDLLSERSGNSEVCAFTVAGEDEKERYYARLAAANLGIPIRFTDNSVSIDPEWFRTSFHTPEPEPWPTNLAAEWANYRQMASHGRVALYGEGPDNALQYEWKPYFAYLVRRRRYRRLIYDLLTHTVLHRRIPLPAVLRMAMRRRPEEPPAQAFPEWFNPDFEKRLQLRARWEQRLAEPPSRHMVRPIAYRSFDNPAWQELFGSFDAERTRSLVEVRHPFLDLRLLRYLLSIPVVPWCRSKYLLRRAMRGRLPPQVLRRPKAPLVYNRWVDRVLGLGLPPLVPAPDLSRYVDTSRVPSAPDVGSFWTAFRTRSLNYWLRNLDHS